jgi:hypothetical protein
MAAVAAQLGREPRAVVGVAHRCPCGLPDVVETAPRLPDGTPFPTLYYLTCPRAAAAVGTLESTGTMAAMTERLRDEPELAAAYRRAHGAYVAARERLGVVPRIAGVSAGGMPDRVKCLHVLIAHALAKGPGVNPFGIVSGQFTEADLVFQMAELIRAANRANTRIYTVDPRGLSAGPPMDINMSMLDWSNYLQTSVSSLQVIADQTGGFAGINRNDFPKLFREIDNDSSDSYIIGWDSSNPDPLRRLRKTLRQHYRTKRRHYGVDYPNFYDADLRRLFSDAPEFAGKWLELLKELAPATTRVGAIYNPLGIGTRVVFRHRLCGSLAM